MPEATEEEWSRFGKHIENFLLLNKEKLIDDNFDLFIGFSRGGVILSNILSCLIKDKFEHYKKTLHKLSLRSIPNTIYSKSDEICFLINKTATEAELDDIYKHLKNDLEKFHSECCEEQQQKLNILVIDDNLTGSTRIFAAKSFLESLTYVGTVKTLAYTRVNDFIVPKLDYQIRDYPANALFFIMPWHYVHIKHQHPILQHKDTETTIYFKFSAKNNIKFDGFLKEIEETIPYIQVYKHDDEDFSEIKDCVNFRIGTIDFGLYYNSQENIIEIYYQIIKIYPPKACLNNNNIFKNDSLCKDLCKEKISNDLCTLCTILNCNKDFFKILLNNGDFSRFHIDYLYGDSVSEDILESVKSWISKNKSELGINF